ncbi:Bug family tripartite tricarboxylate transporter substrate binding protein [Paeniroseomonas aquatica]|uniref:Bug family tripartite tricarboxylate transporter substrate binding protein n=1 Tax=Paeniroseomonas aquatica TaxID=373043 RepID=UPI0036143BA7
MASSGPEIGRPAGAVKLAPGTGAAEHRPQAEQGAAMRIGRRAALAAAFLPLGRPAGAQADYPSRPVRLVVGYPAGGSTDVVARLLAERLGRSLGQPVIVENRPGASGTLGADAVAKAAPDGHTLLVGASGEMAIARATLRSIPYAPEDFAPIALLTEQPFLVLVNGALPADSLAALVALARARPGTLNYGSFGTGTAPHLLGELLKAEAGIEVTHVPYRGSAPLTADLLAGQVQFSFDTIPAALPHLGTGKLRALALCRATRAAAVPGVPTTAEAGMPWLLGGTWASSSRRRGCRRRSRPGSARRCGRRWERPSRTPCASAGWSRSGPMPRRPGATSPPSRPAGRRSPGGAMCSRNSGTG